MASINLTVLPCAANPAFASLNDAAEFTVDSQFEGGLRIAYENFADNYTVALFGRNITNEHNDKGAIDFNNLTVLLTSLVSSELKRKYRSTKINKR